MQNKGSRATCKKSVSRRLLRQWPGLQPSLPVRCPAKPASPDLLELGPGSSQPDKRNFGKRFFLLRTNKQSTALPSLVRSQKTIQLYELDRESPTRTKQLTLLEFTVRAKHLVENVARVWCKLELDQICPKWVGTTIRIQSLARVGFLLWSYPFVWRLFEKTLPSSCFRKFVLSRKNNKTKQMKTNRHHFNPRSLLNSCKLWYSFQRNNKVNYKQEITCWRLNNRRCSSIAELARLSGGAVFGAPIFAPSLVEIIDAARLRRSATLLELFLNSNYERIKNIQGDREHKMNRTIALTATSHAPIKEKVKFKAPTLPSLRIIPTPGDIVRNLCPTAYQSDPGTRIQCSVYLISKYKFSQSFRFKKTDSERGTTTRNNRNWLWVQYLCPLVD